MLFLVVVYAVGSLAVVVTRECYVHQCRRNEYKHCDSAGLGAYHIMFCETKRRHH